MSMSIFIYILVRKFIKNKYNFKLNNLYLFFSMSIEIYSLYLKDILFYIVFELLLFSSLTDVINNDVYTLANIAIFIVGIIYKNNLSEMLLAMLLPFVLFILARISKGIGNGDIELLFCLSSIFNLYQMCLICLIASILNLIYGIHIKRNVYPFIPFMSIACIIVYLVCQSF